MKLKSILKQETKYFVNEQNRTVTATCSAENVLFSITYAIYVVTGLSLEQHKNLSRKLAWTARCSPEDLWNVDIGKKVALEGLYRNEFKPLAYETIAYWQRKLNQANVLLETTVSRTKSTSRNN